MFKLYINSIHLNQLNTWLLIIGGGLVLNHLSLVWKVDQDELLGNSLLLWVAVCLLIWKKRHLLNFNSQPFSTSIGLFLVSFILVRSSSITETNFFVRLSPAISLVGWSLLASGIRGVQQYVKELLILCCLILNSTFMSHVFNISAVTAKFAGYLLWYLGFPVTLQGVNIILPTGSVEVNSGCSGYTIILQLLGLSVVFLSMFPNPPIQKIILPLSAMIIGFLVNIARVALMTILVAANQKEAFLYWHQADGSLIFSGIGVAIFASLYHFLNRHNEIEVTESET
ncbi:cyanoexosortase A [Merismopedia glauca]|uniref:Cyanoexosortase A n=1 Tax=Merismopedia glauca CCAP 1448/3 TaxID=1296344 RepID=A0A2T1C5H1_9CYAN|nr:cyanoexosortase A [Merismopedia glauca]PSB03511.1 cyanoexosortase A [Merismopedia glauca CCAP 1448/3]